MGTPVSCPLVGGHLKLQDVEKGNFLGTEDLETNHRCSFWLG